MKYIILYGMCVIAQMLLFTGCEDKEQVSSYLALDKMNKVSRLRLRQVQKR